MADSAGNPESGAGRVDGGVGHGFCSFSLPLSHGLAMVFVVFLYPSPPWFGHGFLQLFLTSPPWFWHGFDMLWHGFSMLLC